MSRKLKTVEHELTEAVIERIEREVEGGLPVPDAVALTGVPARTWEAWVETHPEIEDRLAQAQARFIKEMVETIKDASKTPTRQGFTLWQAGAWLLERSFPERFANRREAALPGGVVINLLLSGGEKVQLAVGQHTESAGLPKGVQPAIESGEK